MFCAVWDLDTTPRFINKKLGPNSAYFDNHKFKLYKNRSKHLRIIADCDYEINVVCFLTFHCQSL